MTPPTSTSTRQKKLSSAAPGWSHDPSSVENVHEFCRKVSCACAAQQQSLCAGGDAADGLMTRPRRGNMTCEVFHKFSAQNFSVHKMGADRVGGSQEMLRGGNTVECTQTECGCDMNYSCEVRGDVCSAAGDSREQRWRHRDI